MFRDCSGYIELRALSVQDEPANINFIKLDGNWDSIEQQINNVCLNNQYMNVYFGVASRDGKGGKKENITSISCVWAEIDYKHFPEAPEAIVQGIVKKFQFKPTVINSSGGGLHLYWQLEKPVDITRSDDVKKVNDWIHSELSLLCGYELDKISDAARILRLPDTVNHNYEQKPVCRTIESNDHRYTLADFLKVIRPAPIQPIQNHKVTNSKTNPELFAQVKYVVKQVKDQGVLLGDDSHGDWIDIGFALADGLGEDGRRFFHQISSIGSKYKQGGCDKQFTACLKASKPDKKITISTLFHYAKEAGLPIVTEVTEVMGTDRRMIPEYGFPYEILPERVRKIVNDFGTALHVNPEMVAASILPIMGGAIGNAIKISPKAEWEEPPFIWLNFIAVTGHGKTPLISTMLKPINKIQGEAYQAFEKDNKEYERKKEKYKELNIKGEN
jgi:hypothetical protein